MVADQHFAEFLEEEKKRQSDHNALEMSTIEEDALKARAARSRVGGGDTNDTSNNDDENQDGDQLEDQENKGEVLNNPSDGDDGIINEGTEGVSKKKFMMSNDEQGENGEAKKSKKKKGTS